MRSTDSRRYIELSHAIERILRPLIKILIKHGLTNSEFTEMARQTFVEVAYNEFALPDREMTISRAAVLTGLSRKEVQRLLKMQHSKDATGKPTANRASRVVQGWLNDTEFHGKNGKPLSLPIKKMVDNKERGSFVALVKRYSGDITYGAILDELDRTGVTDRTRRGLIRLVNPAGKMSDRELSRFRKQARAVSDILTQ